MKKFIHSIIFIFLISGVAKGQDIIYTISGELNNTKVPLDSILFENVSNNTWLTFRDLPVSDFYQINLSQQSLLNTGVIPVLKNEQGFIETESFPGTLTLLYKNIASAEALITIYNLAGQLVYSVKSENMTAGNSLKVQFGDIGVYIVKIELPYFTQTFKAFGSSTQKNFNTFVVDDNNHKQLSKRSFQNADFGYTLGDSIRISAYNNKSYSEPIKLNITESQVINFSFNVLADSSKLASGNVKINGVPNMSLSGLTVQSYNRISQVKINGDFQLPNETVDNEQLPLLVMKDGKVMFGFYPKSPTNNTVNPDNILLFYLKLFPDIAFLGLTDSTIIVRVHSDSNYTHLINLIGNELNGNLSPSDNPTLKAMLQVTADNMIKLNNTAFKSKKDLLPATEFKFEFDRNGLIKWASDPLINARMGFEIILNDNSKVYGPYLFEPFKWVFSLTSIASWGLDKLFSVDKETKLPSFQFNNEGDYHIYYTNGNTQVDAPDDLYQEVSKNNKNDFMWDLIFLVVPPAAESLFKKCGQSITEMFFLQAEYVKNLILKDVTTGEITTAIYETGNNFLKIASECELVDVASLNYFKNYMELMKKVDVLGTAESAANFISFAHDFYGSEIDGVETRHYFQGVSFGDLEYSPLKSYFEGVPDNEEQYFATVTEKISKYNIERGLTKTNFNQVVNWNGANNVPFNATLLSGDVKIENANPLTTSPIGNLFCPFIIGKDSSKIKIEPAFSNSGINPGNITIIPTKSISLSGSSYKLVSYRFVSIPGYINFATCNNPPYLSYVGNKILKFDTNTYSVSITDIDGKISTSGPYNYTIGTYYTDSLFLSYGIGYNCTNSYGHQYNEGWGIKIPPGYNLNFEEYWPTRISKEGNQIYRAQSGDEVYIKQ